MGQNNTKSRSGATTPSYPPDPGILILHSPSKEQPVEPKLAAVEKVPSFLPLIPESINPNFLGGRSNAELPRISPDPLYQLLGTYQDLLHKSSTSIAYEQAILGTKLKAVETKATLANSTSSTHERHLFDFSRKLQDGLFP
jgi:hypothetical protein